MFVAYASSTLALATLEYLAHIDREDAPTDLVRVSVSFEDRDVEALVPPYPVGWDGLAPSNAAQRVGNLWARERRTLVLEVPSVIVPDERNYVINPNHPRFVTLAIGPLKAYNLDPRLLR